MSVRKDSLQVNYIQKACFKHPEKAASHQLQGKASMHDSFYCQKCSIMLASQGYNVVKLATINNAPFAKKDSTSSKHSRSSSSRHCPLPSNRKNEISYFVQNLDSLNMQMIKKIEVLQDHLMKSQSQYGKMIEEANKFYSQIQEIIQLQKYTTYNSILNKRSIEETKIREARQYIFEKRDQIEAIINDIRENMDAVQTVDYSIYNAIMGGYQAKYQNLKDVVKQSLTVKPVDKYEIVFPQIPKFLVNLSEKISISVKKSIVSTVQSSINASVKPQRIISQDDQAFGSQQSQYDQHSSIQRDSDSRQEFKKQGDQFLYDPKQIINGRGNLQELAFSFDQNTNNEKEVIILDDCNIIGNGNSIHLRGFQGNFSKIQQRVNSKEVCESRESLGEYLNISSSRQRHYAQDTETLLIA